MSKQRASFWIGLFFAALTVIGLLTVPQYGMPVDEPAEQVILLENIKEYAIRFCGEPNEAVRRLDAMGVGRISESIERDHGECAYYLAAPLLLLGDSAPDTLMALWHAYTWLWFMAGVVALYHVARALSFGRPVACATALLLYLSPRFFAEGHYNNKDVVLLSLVLWTLAAGIRFHQAPTVRHAVFFALAGAMAANTKIIGLLPWGLVGLATLAGLVATRTLTRRHLWGGLAAIAFTAGFYVLLTPALWADPPGYVRYLVDNATGFSRWTGMVLYRGAYYDPSRGLPLPHSYLPVMILLTVPLATLALAAFGQLNALRLIFRGDERRPLLLAVTALWLIPVLYVVWRQPLMYNGWRHFYFLYAAVAVMGGLGLDTLAGLVRGKPTLQRLAGFALAGMLAFQAVGIAWNHPFQYVYYNPLAGDVSQRYELDYWGVSTLTALRRLCQTEGGTADIPLTVGAPDEMSLLNLRYGYPNLSAAQQAGLRITTDTDAAYLFENTMYARMYDVAVPAGYVPLFSCTSYGHTLCTVYRRQ